MTPKIYFTIFSCLLFLLQTADGLLWIVTPNALVNVQQGRYTTLRWHYEMEKNENFLSSELANGETDAFASRHPGENKYYIYKENQTKYSISGKNDVGLTIFSTELGSHIYCCIVQFYTTSGKERKPSCATVFVYDRPCIIHHTPQLSCKQGDQVRLQCNATGHPEPRVRWIHRDTNKFIGNSSVTSLNITGKKSEGSYCCRAQNKFEEDTACTTVNVTDYAPINTVLSSNNPYAIRNGPLEMRCSASAFPPPTQFLWDFNTRQYNSSNGTYNFKVDNGTKDVSISCIPFNVYGQGPVEKRILPVYEPPRFTSELRERYYMTTDNVTMTCSVTGNPTPDIKWTNVTGERLSTEENYTVLYIDCANETKVYYCHASNILGSITRKMHMQVTTGDNDHCSSGLVNAKEKNKFWLTVYLPVGLSVGLGALIAYFYKKRSDSAKNHKRNESIANGDAVHQETTPLTDFNATATDNPEHQESQPATPQRNGIPLHNVSRSENAGSLVSPQSVQQQDGVPPTAEPPHQSDPQQSVDPGYELNEINEDGHQGNVNAAVPEQKTVELEVRPEEDMQENDITGSSLTRTVESPVSPRSVPQLIETKQIQEPTTSNHYSQYDEEDNQYYRNLARLGNPEQQSLLEDSQGESSFRTLSSAKSSLLDYHTEKLR